MYQKVFVAALLVLGTASMALAAVPAAEVAAPVSSVVGCGGAALPASAGGLTGVLPLEQAIGDVGSAACCYSDPCPGWGSYKVSCCATTCSGYPDKVYCSGEGYKYCPDPCASNGICNSSCSYDPDCGGSCDPGAMCEENDDCGYTQGLGYCDKEIFEFFGNCVCDF